MASAFKSDEETPSESESDFSDESDSDEKSVEETDYQDYVREPCKFYNSGGCRDGKRCPYLHVCKYALKGNCRHGSNCKLNHSGGGMASSGERNRASYQSAYSDPKLTDGRYYQWQLNDGNDWMNIDNDHIIEAQYSLPHTKSIKIYNTPYGAVSIDFNRMRVYGKSLRVRRLDDGNTVWIWYCTLRRTWIRFGDKDSKGNPSPVKSSDIEIKFQSNPTSSYTFNTGAETFEIRFRDMQQVSKKKKRRVTRRPLYRQQQAAGVSQAVSAFQRASLGTKPQWQFEGDSGAWHHFKHRQRGTSTDCSITSADIERKYQQNVRDTMIFKVQGNSYNDDPNQPEDQAFTQDQTCAGMSIKGDLEVHKQLSHINTLIVGST